MPTKNKIALATLLCSSMISVAPVFSSSCTPAALSAVHDGDQKYIERLDLSKAQASLDLYQSAMKEDAACYEAAWKAARIAWWIGDRGERKSKAERFQKAVDLSKTAIALDKESPEGHFWLAAAWGSYGEEKGVLKSLALVKPIRAELNEILRLKPDYDGGAAYRVLGIVDYKVPGFAGGSKKRALQELSQAEKLNGSDPFNEYYLAEYFQVTGDRKAAAQHLDRLDNLKADGEAAADLFVMKEKGAALRKKL